MYNKEYQPVNDNLLQLSKFTFVIPNLKHTTYYCQSVALPGVRTNGAMVPTPFSETYRHGDKMFFDNLRLTILADEDFRAYEEIFKWMISNTFPNAFEEYGDQELYRDSFLIPQKNSNIDNVQFKFKYCHPISIDGMNFDTRVSADTVPTFDVTFQLDTFEIIRNST